jgi:2-methylcitrate dehydratase PrpD
MGITETIAHFVVESTLDQMPAHGIAIAKEAIIDCLGVALAGSQTETGMIITRVVREFGGTPDAGVFAGGFRTAAPFAALANGTMAHALDYDDVTKNMGHPSPPLLPVIMALGEAYGASGQEILEAYIVGFEVQSKLGNGMSRQYYARGWHSTATLGTIGAAAAAAKLLRLDPVQVRMALGIAASEAAGIRQNFGSMTKPFHAGNAAKSGVLAAVLAQEGFTADPNILEAELGYLHVFAGPGEYNLEKIVADLGTEYNIVTYGVGLKPYPCCRGAHTALDALLHLVYTHQIVPEGVASIEAEVSARVPQMMIHARPKTALEGKFSLQYCLARAVLDKKLGVHQFTEEKVLASDAHSLMERIHIVHPAEEDPWSTTGSQAARVTVTLEQGEQYTHQVEVPKGDPTNPMTQEEIVAKYRDCTQLVFGEAEIERSLHLLTTLETIESVVELAEIVTFRKAL